MTTPGTAWLAMEYYPEQANRLWHVELKSLKKSHHAFPPQLSSCFCQLESLLSTMVMERDLKDPDEDVNLLLTEQVLQGRQGCLLCFTALQDQLILRDVG